MLLYTYHVWLKAAMHMCLRVGAVNRALCFESIHWGNGTVGAVGWHLYEDDWGAIQALSHCTDL